MRSSTHRFQSLLFFYSCILYGINTKALKGLKSLCSRDLILKKKKQDCIINDQCKMRNEQYLYLNAESFKWCYRPKMETNEE